MEIKGRIISICPLKSGQGNNGVWRSQDYVLEEIEGQYPKKISFNAFGDNIDKFAIQIGEVVNVSINLESREHNGNWYLSAKAWKVEKLTAAAPLPQQQPQQPATHYQQPAQSVQQPQAPVPTGNNDLPF